MTESLSTLAIFAALSLGLAATPGPNMLYIVTRSLAQGTTAGMVSLIGCQFGSLLIMVLATLGITAALFAVPYAYDALRLGGGWDHGQCGAAGVGGNRADGWGAGGCAGAV